MSRIVLLEFADNAAAELFVRVQAAKGSESAYEELVAFLDTNGVHSEPLSALAGAKVAAVVAKPTKWCTCNVPESTGRRRRQKRESGWTRGTSFGWWLCIHCHRPSKAMVTHFVTNMLTGANDLTPKILETGAPRSPRERWEDEGGIPNESANSAPAMPFATGSVRARRKPINPRSHSGME